MTTFLFPYSFSSASLNLLAFPERQKTSTLLPGTVIRDPCGVACYPPAPVGCCTMGLDGLVESVLMVVVDAAPSSRLRVMIHAIMGASSCLALLFPPGTEARAQKICRRHTVRKIPTLHGVKQQTCNGKPKHRSLGISRLLWMEKIIDLGSFSTVSSTPIRENQFQPQMLLKAVWLTVGGKASLPCISKY